MHDPLIVSSTGLLCDPLQLESKVINVEDDKSPTVSSGPADSVPASPLRDNENGSGPIHRRLSRRNAAILANQEFASQRNSTATTTASAAAVALKDGDHHPEQKVTTESNVFVATNSLSSTSASVVGSSDRKLRLLRSKQGIAASIATKLPDSARKVSLAAKKKAK